MINDLRKLVKDTADVTLLQDALEFGSSRALIHAITVLRDHLRQEVEDRPQRDDTELRNDIVYKIGMIAALNWALSIPTKARELITSFEGREVE
jgi:hypothetical protein